MNVHSGTHIDAPYHFLPDGKPFPSVPLDSLIGEVHVFHSPVPDCIDVRDLESLCIPSHAERVLFRTRNSSLWQEDRPQFHPDYVALTPAAADWVAARGIKLVGIDYLSIQRYSDPTPRTHLALLSAGVVILEGLNLHDVLPGAYLLVCLPLKTGTKDGAPARAVLIQE
jgi:arylformamidase